MKTLLTFFFLFFSSSVFSNTYEDCILENMKNIDNDTAARAIINACKTKFKSDSSGIQLDNSNNTLIVLACAGSEFEFKYDKSDIENSVYYKVEGTKFQWKKRKVYSFDSE